MLPFLKPKKVAGIIISHRKPDSDEPKPLDQEEGDENHAMEACAEDILRAISSKDAKHLALALQAAFDCMESGEDNEEDQAKPEPHSYDAQNEKAAK